MTIQITSYPNQYARILTPGAQTFLATLHRCFNKTRIELLQAREVRLRDLEAGVPLDFLPETAFIRNNHVWRGAKPAPGLRDRRVEITGPVSRKMVINALNSGSSTFMADFEDSTSPTWTNVLDGQLNLLDANSQTIDFKDPKSGKSYALNKDIATLLVRPRGWHMVENHFQVDGAPMSASLFDFGLYFYHNAHLTVKNGRGPYFYLPKMEHYLEARLWNDVFNLAQDTLQLPRGTIRGTVLIETILASFQMDEIIYELREHSSGLNCGRWDYIFSFIKKFKHDPSKVLPDRGDITMTTPFMSAYVKLLIKTCHLRAVHAMGGMAAQIPIKNDPSANAAAMTKVRNDKMREHDGTWVAHPDLVKVAMDVFNTYMPQANQLYKQFPDTHVGAAELLDVTFPGKITWQGVVGNVQIGLLYVQAWLAGNGCVPIHNLMEDAATAEISRSQLYQWVRHASKTTDGQIITREAVHRVVDTEVGKMGKDYEKAGGYLKAMVGDCPDFITTFCYDAISTPSESVGFAAKL